MPSKARQKSVSEHQREVGRHGVECRAREERWLNWLVLTDWKMSINCWWQRGQKSRADTVVVWWMGENREKAKKREMLLKGRKVLRKALVMEQQQQQRRRRQQTSTSEDG